MPATLFVTLREIALHCWPEAPEKRAYQRESHRHTFEIRISTPLDQRKPLDAHSLLDDAREAFSHMAGRERDLLDRSCEQIALGLAGYLCELHLRPMTVECAEDGECGASVSVDYLGLFKPDGETQTDIAMA